MKVFDPKDIRNVAFVGHKACGKTSVAESALWSAGATNRLGSTAGGTSVLDYEDEEHKRVMSTSTSLGALEWNKTKINLLDTPAIVISSKIRAPLCRRPTAPCAWCPPKMVSSR